MTKNQAIKLSNDLRKSFTDEDFSDDIYLSIRNVGSVTLKSSSYLDVENYLIIWTMEETFIFNKKDIGDLVFVPSKDPISNIKWSKSCY